jgi:hypothetical protein
MSDITFTDDNLIKFLRDLADSVENEEILPAQKRSVGEFLMSYQFLDQMVIDNSETETDINFSKHDMIKFITLGWFVYCMMLKDKPLPVYDPSDDINTENDLKFLPDLEQD